MASSSTSSAISGLSASAGRVASPNMSAAVTTTNAAPASLGPQLAQTISTVPAVVTTPQPASTTPVTQPIAALPPTTAPTLPPAPAPAVTTDSPSPIIFTEPSTPRPRPTLSRPSSGGGGLSSGALAGIIAGSVLGAILLIWLIVWLCRRPSSTRTSAVGRKRPPVWTVPVAGWNKEKEEPYRPDNTPTYAASARHDQDEELSYVPAPTRRLSNPYSTIGDILQRSEAEDRPPGQRRVVRRPTYL